MPSQGLMRAARLFEWIENHLKIRRKNKKLTLFRFNTVQQILCEYIAERWDKNLSVKCLIPKARQMGVSTFWQAVMFARCVLDPGHHAVVVSHDEASVDKIFEKSRTFERHLPAEWRFDLDHKQGGKLVWTRGSSFWVASVKSGDALEKGGTLTDLHFSEVASFADRGANPDLPIASAVNALADGEDTRDALIVFESTAKGRDPCFWSKCEDAKNPESRSEYTLIFLPWYLESAYSMGWAHYRHRLISAGRKDPGEKFRATEDELLLRQHLRDRTIGRHEKWFAYPIYLTEEQLIWRRWCTQNRCEGKPHLFSRYYPATYEEAFASTATGMFPAETVEYYRQRSKKALTVGNLLRAGKRVEFDANGRGYLRMWERPAPGERYFIGADIGGERKNSDPCAAYVVTGHLKVVAAVHGHMEFDEYAEYLSKLGQFFNWAMLVVENNHNPAVASTLHRDGYPRLYYYVDVGVLKGVPNKPGFNTNRKTRPELVAYLDKVTRDKVLVCPDEGFAREMESFVWLESKSHYAAGSSDHDDRIMAMALAVFCAPRDEVFTQPSAEAAMPWALQRWSRIQRLLAEREPESRSQGVMF